MNALRKVVLLSLGLIAASLGPVRAETGPQPERPYSVAQMGTYCYRDGMQMCWASYRLACRCYPTQRTRCAWVHTGQRC